MHVTYILCIYASSCHNYHIINFVWSIFSCICSGVQATVTVQKSKTSVDASLKDISVFDPTPGAIYPKVGLKVIVHFNFMLPVITPF